MLKTLSILLVLMLLSFCCRCTAQQEDQDPGESANEEGSPPSDRWKFVAWHVAGVAGAILASFTRSSYACSIFYDRLMTIGFYISVIALGAVAIYVTYIYESADMLLIGAAAGMILFGLHIPRFWSIDARKLHWDSPMWRIKDGIIYKRTRRILKEEEKNSDYTWNGYEFDDKLVDKTTNIKEIVEGDSTHWERTVAYWQDFVVRGRLGEQPSRRAALALRMAFSVPMPVWVQCSEAEYYAARGALGVEVMKTWEIGTLKTLLTCSLFSNNGEKTWQLCEERFELAYFLHLGLLLHESNIRKEEWEKKRIENQKRRQGDIASEDSTQTQNERRTEKNDDKDWTKLVTEWLFGELVVQDVDKEAVEAFEGVLAYGFYKLKNPGGSGTDVSNTTWGNGENGSQTTGSGRSDALQCWYLVGQTSAAEKYRATNEGGAQGDAYNSEAAPDDNV